MPKKNIELNHLENVIEAHNCGMADRTKSASIVNFEDKNMGATQLPETDGGNMRLIALDDMSFSFDIEFVKIDVEDMEYDWLQGGKSSFSKHSPIVFIEIWEDNFERVDSLMQQYGYRVFEKRPAENYVYRRARG